MTWGFIWLMFVLKIPIIGLFGIVWWAVRKSDEPSDAQPVRPTPAPARPHPRSRLPRPRRPRGPHAEPMPLPPARTRRVTAIGREHAPDR
jgi:hypothetical protein